MGIRDTMSKKRCLEKPEKMSRSPPAPRQESYDLCPYGRTETTLISSLDFALKPRVSPIPPVLKITI